MTQAQRDADPSRLIAALCVAPGLNGFRFFNDHDARVLDIALPDPRCAKIVLTRNPVESYVAGRSPGPRGNGKAWTNAQHRNLLRSVHARADIHGTSVTGCRRSRCLLPEPVEPARCLGIRPRSMSPYARPADVAVHVTGLAPSWAVLPGSGAGIALAPQDAGTRLRCYERRQFRRVEQALGRVASRINLTWTSEFRNRDPGLVPAVPSFFSARATAAGIPCGSRGQRL